MRVGGTVVGWNVGIVEGMKVDLRGNVEGSDVEDGNSDEGTKVDSLGILDGMRVGNTEVSWVEGVRVGWNVGGAVVGIKVEGCIVDSLGKFDGVTVGNTDDGDGQVLE